MGIEHTTLTITVLFCHALLVSDCLTLKSCSIESRNDSKSKTWSGAWNKAPFKDLLCNTCLGGRVDKGLTSNPVIVGVVSSNPTGGIFMFFSETFLNPSMSILYSYVRFVFLTTTSIMIRVFLRTHRIDKNGNIGITGFTMWKHKKKSSKKMLAHWALNSLPQPLR